MRRIQNLSLFVAALAGIASAACQSGGVGDPCIPEDEYVKSFPGFAYTEVNVESKSFQCETRVCLSAYFQGRVTCPYGQPDPNVAASGDPCYLPGATGDQSAKVSVEVKAWVQKRPPSKAVYCSCRCNGPDKSAKYCECPSGYACQKLIENLGLEGGQLAGSYCVKEGTQIYDPTKEIQPQTCTVPGGPCPANKHPGL